MTILSIILIVAGSSLAVALVVALVVWLFMPVSRGLGRFFAHVWTFIAGVFKELARLVACIIVAPVFATLAVLSIVFFQKVAAARFARAFKDEGLRMVVCVYRIFVGLPSRLLGVETAMEGIETRLPTVLTSTWGDAVSPRTSLFPGYTIVRTLAAGGSGAKLYVAEADRKKRKELARDGFAGGQVVIKSFTTYENDGLLTIVRESRALEVGRRMGLILEHVLTPERFYYVMRYVPGENLRVVTNRLHEASGDEGLDDARLRVALGYVRDLLETLRSYHEAGLWHKDVKPDNVIVEPAADAGPVMAGAGEEAEIEALKRSPVIGTMERGRATLVDFGLVSSLRSAMTLTTHGTEYYRDPEMVRRALRGVKVHEVDGVRFDVYAAGAVLFSVIEDSFPAQGVLSPIRKRCPGAVGWIIRRAMADYDQRYESAQEMLTDLERVLAAEDMFGVRPADLPSMGGEVLVLPAGEERPRGRMLPAGVGAGVEPVALGAMEGPGSGLAVATTGVAVRTQPTGGSLIRLKNWWTGRAEVVGPLPASVDTSTETR
ncbi:MAG TPA: hypothetical protein VHN77_09340 [Phycisphaerales bacterium]|nr:hypothetical protein [Phycisphaerales bacterium]